MLLRVSVDFSDTPESMVTPVNAALLLKDSTVTEMSSPDIDGTKHSIPDIITTMLKEICGSSETHSRNLE